MIGEYLFEPKLCEHGIAAGCCYSCAQEEAEDIRNRKRQLSRIRFKFDAASLHPIRPDAFKEIVVTHPITNEQRSLFVPDTDK